jgi:O-antigen/teichoic acid export membrane protein
MWEMINFNFLLVLISIFVLGAFTTVYFILNTSLWAVVVVSVIAAWNIWMYVRDCRYILEKNKYNGIDS